MDYSGVISKIKDKIALVLVISNNEITSKGSGFIFWRKGLLVTCNHVVKGDHDRIMLQFSDTPSGQFIDAKLILQDPKHDLAILEFEDPNREPLEMHSSEGSILEGMPVLFAGYPLTITSLTSHQGILSSISLDATGLTTYLIDGTVNPGNSGCPLMCKDGTVIGVVNATRRENFDLLQGVNEMPIGAVALHGVDLIKIYQALISNLQLGVGYAVPCGYIPKPT